MTIRMMNGTAGLTAAFLLLCLASPFVSRADTELVVAPAAPKNVAATALAAAAIDTVAITDSVVATDSVVLDQNFGRAALEVVGVNTAVWLYDRFIRAGGGEGFRVGLDSWIENIKNGFEWDDNSFSTNQFAHPYHGSLYFNAARSNGYGFWESMPFTFAGSFMWEYFSETHHPSVNDWIATSVGGIALGETLWRLSSALLDNTATGSERRWREVGAFAINPMRGFNRLLTGEASRVHANPPDRFPNAISSHLEVGLRTIGEEAFGESDTTRAFIELEFDYGDPFAGDLEKPYDHFDFALQVNFKDKSSIGRAQVKGLLAGLTVRETENSHHIIAAFQHFDFISNNAYELGGQSVGASYLSRFETERGLVLRSALHLNVILLGAAKSDYLNFSGREYDYGPGFGFKFEGYFGQNHWQYLTVAHEQYLIHAVNGNKANHLISFSRVKLNVPVADFVGVGAEYILYLADAFYEDYPDVTRRNPELRVYATWQLD